MILAQILTWYFLHLFINDFSRFVSVRIVTVRFASTIRAEQTSHLIHNQEQAAQITV